jgi:hypothetical protein
MQNLRDKILDELPYFSFITPSEMARQIGTSEIQEVRDILWELTHDGLAWASHMPLTESEKKQKGIPLDEDRFRWVFYRL